jgi:D-alanyl-lipoteichoic acid acyltransferase DltB (MBOAT superfamily)
MLFTSLPFVAFLFLTVLTFYLFPKRIRWTVLLVASMFFYGYAGLHFLAYIAATIVSTHLCAMHICGVYAKRDAEVQALSKSEKEARKSLRTKAKSVARKWLLLSLILNFGILAVIKYTNFLIGNVNFFLSPDAQLGFLTIAVPMGIS